MKRIVVLSLGILGLLAVGFVAAATMLDTPSVEPGTDGPGYVVRDVDASHREGPFAVHIWYPSAKDGTPTWIGRNGLFFGTDVQQDATPLPGPYPVAFMSHGSGGNGPRMAWLAAALVEAGWVVVTPDHPGTTSGDSLPEATVRVWERPEDFAAIQQQLEQIIPEGLSLTGTRTAVGFSLGGHTALAMAGVRVSAEAFRADCATRSDHDCGWLARGGVDLAAIDAERYGADLSLPGIVAVAAVDPGLPAAMTDDSLRRTSQPTLLINLGAPAPQAIRADGIAALLPNAQLIEIDGTGHFAMLSECSQLGQIILGLMVRDDENICATHAKPRADVQQTIAAEIVAFLAPLR